MDFGNFGVVSFTSQAKVSPFVDYLEKGKFMATKCKKCKKSFFPPQLDCPNCISSEVEWFEISSLGTLLTFTMVNYGPSGFENDAPYTLGIAEFEEGVKVLGRISKDVATEDIRIGMKVKLSPTKINGGRVAYEMKPAQ